MDQWHEGIQLEEMAPTIAPLVTQMSWMVGHQKAASRESDLVSPADLPITAVLEAPRRLLCYELSASFKWEGENRVPGEGPEKVW